MLEGIPELEGMWILHRLAVQPEFAETLDEDNFETGEDSQEMIELLVERLLATVLGRLCDAPFKAANPPISRYSDGSIPVFYGSLESKTAESEAKHRLLIRIAADPSALRTVYYVRFRCSFSGVVKDLRGMENDWPNLVHDSNYEFCNSLGLVATEATLDGLLVPSVRRMGGTNVPVFSRKALGVPFESEISKFTYNADSDDIEVIPIR